MMKPYSLEEFENIIADHYPEFDGIHPAANLFPLPSEEDYTRLVESMKEGLLEPLSRSADGLLLDGRSRLMACYDTNTEIRLVDVSDRDYIHWSVCKNMDRRHLSAAQKAFVALDVRRLYAEEAKAKQVEGSKQSPLSYAQAIEKHNKEVVVKLPPLEKSRDKAGDIVGVSGSYVDMARNIQENAPELKAQIDSGTLSLRDANKEAVKLKNAQKVISEKISTQSVIVTVDGRTALMDSSDKPVFNKTNDNVEWADWTWNPVTGCNHGCNFCYARAITHNAQMARNYPFKFEPAFYEYRLTAPVNSKLPKDLSNPANGRVFVGSMADLFGKWVPDEWITKVFNACMSAPEWEYLFLTKWPNRYKMLADLPNAWFGASVIQQADVIRVEREMQMFKTNGVKWISLEPMLEPIVFNDLQWCDLVVIGAQTSTYQPTGYVGEVSPQFDWIVDVVNQCRAFGVPYYLKPNLSVSPGMNLTKMKPRRQ